VLAPGIQPRRWPPATPVGCVTPSCAVPTEDPTHNPRQLLAGCSRRPCPPHRRTKSAEQVPQPPTAPGSRAPPKHHPTAAHVVAAAPGRWQCWPAPAAAPAAPPSTPPS
jgi:hypothetical protein